MAKPSAEPIDPYVEILQLDPKDCPPDHYVLLGLPRYTSDHEQIQSAANEQIRYVRPFCARYPAEGTQLLNELTKAKLCLLDDEERTAYDADLRQSEDRVAVVRAAAPTVADTESFADVFGDELDAMAEERMVALGGRRCPHCGSGLFESDKYCQSCTGGLADGTAWLSAKCPECQKLLARGAVVCKMCDADLSITDVIGCIPSHVPGSIRPFESQQRKKLRLARRQAMQAWTHSSQAEPPGKSADDETPVAPAGQPPSSRRKFDEEPLPTVPALILKAASTLLGKTGIEGDAADVLNQRYRAARAWWRERHTSVGTIAAYLGIASIPVLGLIVILALVGGDASPISDIAPASAAPLPPEPDETKDSEEVVVDDTAEDVPPGDMPALPVTEAQRRFENMRAEALQFVTRRDFDTPEQVRPAMRLAATLTEFERELVNDSATFAKLADLKSELINKAADGLTTLLDRLSDSSGSSDPQFDDTRTLLDEVEADVLRNSANWPHLESAARSYVLDEVSSGLYALSKDTKFEEAAQLAETVEAPLLISDYTPELRKALHDKLKTEINEFGGKVKKLAEMHAYNGNVDEALKEFDKLCTGRVGMQLSQYLPGYLNAIGHTVLDQSSRSDRTIEAKHLMSVLDKAQTFPELRDGALVHDLRERLNQITFISKTANVTNKVQAIDILEPGQQRDDFEDLLRKLQSLKAKSGIRPVRWYVIWFDVDKEVAKFENPFQAAAAVVLYRSTRRSLAYYAGFSSTEADAQALMRNPSPRKERQILEYPQHDESIESLYEAGRER